MPPTGRRARRPRALGLAAATLAAITGAGVIAVIQPSLITAVPVVGFVSAGVLTFIQSAVLTEDG